MTGLNIQSLAHWKRVSEGHERGFLQRRMSLLNDSKESRYDTESSCKTHVAGEVTTLRKRTYSLFKKCAFTLAEVLITLGIIGVVAASTIPSLVSHYQRKVLETQFKKSYSVLSQSMISVQSEFLSCPAGSAEEIKKLLFSQFNNLGSSANSKLGYDNFKTYTKKITTAKIHPNCFANINQVQQFKDENIIATDGMAIAFCLNQTYGNMISIDTNGPKKGPNAFGA